MRNVAKALLNAMPSGLRERLRSAYIWNVRTGVYRQGVPSEAVRTSAEAWGVLAHDYGFVRSLREGSCVRADGSPIPWLTYPAIDYLDTLDLSACRVFEYGAGSSTRYWAARATRVDAVEFDARWHAMIAPTMPPHGHVRLETDLEQYIAAVGREPEGYDVIIIDGQNQEQCRMRCAKAAIPALRPGGMIILDNATYLPHACAVLREAGLIEVRFSGFFPLGACTSTTAFYLRRDFSIPRRSPSQGLHAIGTPDVAWEDEPREAVV